MEAKKQKPTIRQQKIFSELFAKISSNCCNDNPIIFVGLLLMPSFERLARKREGSATAYMINQNFQLNNSFTNLVKQTD